MATITINGTDIQIPDTDKLNVIQAADRMGVTIPYYCWHPGLSVVASCRMCLVEVGTKNKETGKVDMLPKLVPACQTPAKDGTVVVTDSQKVKDNQNFVQEGLLLDHPVDCPICDKAGECLLQDYYFDYGHKERRADVRPFTSERRDLGPHVTLFADRCVMCSRCVRFTREVSGDASLQVIQRGSHAEIDIFEGFPIDNKMSGNVNDICPVGALCSKDFLYTQRVWFLEPHDSVCTKCSTGCSIQHHVAQNKLYRIQPRYNPNVNDWWMCDIGRYENEYIEAPERLSSVKRRSDDRWEDLLWDDGLKAAKNLLLDATNRHGGSKLAFVISPFLTVEEAYLFATFARTITKHAKLYLGKVPVAAEGDEKFKSGFTIRAERCPNRKGVEAVLKHFDTSVGTWDDFLSAAEAGQVSDAWVTGNYPSKWNDEADAARLKGLRSLVVQDILPSPLARQAQIVVAGVSAAEKEGCYVNHAGLIQRTQWALRPVESGHTDGQTLSHLLGRKGLYSATDVLSEVADLIPYFAPAKSGIPEAGLNLEGAGEIIPRTTALGTVTHPTPTFRPIASPLLEVEG